jgi:hypothetical protein
MMIREKLEERLKHLSMFVVPHELLYWLWHQRRRGMPRTEDGTTEELRTIPVQGGVRLEVYWTVVEQGAGPCASLFVLDEEVLRLDCFAGKHAHMHLNPVQLNLPLPWKVTPRIAFPDASARAQIARAAFELEVNTQTTLQMNQRARIRGFFIEPAGLAAAAKQMQSYMLELVDRRGASETSQERTKES